MLSNPSNEVLHHPVCVRFPGVACWTQTGERQTACLRFKYLQSVLRKDIKFFDTEAREKNIIFHISSDAVLVQDAIGDKVHDQPIEDSL